ncbi:aldehyde dehydrogenase [Marmoricola sp. Leaf446]|uniref:aldehyde dehydrogenase n=1 Tax=Marmoricola sp. Leaf446 TaxID=1736379 RepID=UPI0006FA4121|nr:aldehyde dehydrogenase [Marmoricola sp. Leaf446]KQT93506.1 aldehyde dehydrogenase [Marmoricola sp. Leaf446]
MPKLTYSDVFIGGELVAADSSEELVLTSPVTEEEIGRVPSASTTDVDRAVAAAKQAFHGEWRGTTLDDRLAIIRRLRDLIVENREELSVAITRQMGCPITQSRAIQTDNTLRAIDAYLDFVPDYPFRTLRRSSTANALVTREPVGVVAAVSPWNMPLAINVQKLLPAVIAGCTMVLKPSPETPVDAFMLAELLVQAGLPAGVFNVVPAERDTSAYLVGHPDVDKVTFTGSPAAGRAIAARCGEDLRRVTLELGGKSAAILLPDADLDQAVEAMRMGSFRNSGQVCSLKTRVLVHRDQHDEVVERMVGLVESMPVGDPIDEATQIGPMVSRRQRDVVEGYIAAGSQEGARLVVGGGRPRGLDRGYFVEPTIFTGATPDMRIVREEIFGPVVSVLAYEDEDEAVAMANNSAYGLNGSVFTADLDHGLAVAGRLQTGTVELNGSGSGYYAPMGGVKTSGLGRENGPEGLDAYLELKSVGLSVAAAERLAGSVDTHTYR